METLDRILQAVSLDETHRVERPPIRVLAQPIHRHDARMLQAAGDLRFEQEARAAFGVAGVTFLDLLQRHFAVQLFIMGDIDLSQSPLRMWPKYAETQPARSRLPKGDSPGEVFLAGAGNVGQ